MIRICGDLRGHLKDEREETDESKLSCEEATLELPDNIVIVVVQQERALETVAA
jgi:hypothetical protein